MDEQEACPLMRLPPATIDEQKECPLFRLPPELRNKIYAYTLHQKEPKQKTETRLPLESPLEVIDLNDATSLMPSNELLLTCRYFYTEAYSLFVAAQREFWKSNNFLVDLRDDWEDAASGDAAKPRTDLINMPIEYFNEMQTVVVSVTHGSHHDEHHLMDRDGSWLPRLFDPIGGNPAHASQREQRRVSCEWR
jgi:hypothetical protein